MNYYEILEVKRDASPQEIRKRYKALIKKYHPDLYVGDKKFAEDKTMQINLAYDVLSVPELREEYDLELELEEEKNRRASNSSDNYNNTDNNDSDTTNEYDSDYMNDPVFRNMYERYNLYKNNYIFHKKYSKQGPYGTNSGYRNTYADKVEEEFDRHVKKAEGYVEKKIQVLKLKQKILLAIIALLIVIMVIILSIYRILTLSSGSKYYYNNPKTSEQKEYNVKPDDTNDNKSFLMRFIEGLYNSYVQDVISENEPDEPEDPDDQGNKKSQFFDLEDIQEKINTFRLYVGNYEINTDVLNSISNDVKVALDFYYNAIKDAISNTELSKYSEDEIKVIIYNYLQKNQFDWYNGEENY